MFHTVETQARVSRPLCIVRSDFENSDKTTTEIKSVLQKRGVPPKMIRSGAIAAYELEMSLVVHSDGGTLTFRTDEQEIQLIAQDQRPGIANVNPALQEGWATAYEWMKSLGFGAGMGLPNAKTSSEPYIF
jgi:anti-sigma regulatory factor (Ser/Thr protein kinase)